MNALLLIAFLLLILVVAVIQTINALRKIPWSFLDFRKSMLVRVMSLAFHFQITATAADVCLLCPSSKSPIRLRLVFSEPYHKMERSAIHLVVSALFQSRNISEHAASFACVSAPRYNKMNYITSYVVSLCATNYMQ
jgi:hypothetical protein